MCTYFKTETDVAQNLIDGFFSNFDSSIGRILSEKKKKKKYWGIELLSEKTEAWHAELDEIAEAATSSYSAAVGFLQYIYLVLVAQNQ